MKSYLKNTVLFLVLVQLWACGKSTSSLNDFQIVRGVTQNETIQSNDFIDITIEQTDPKKAQAFIKQKKSDFNESLLTLNSVTGGSVQVYYPRSGYTYKLVQMPQYQKEGKYRIDVVVDVFKRHVKMKLRKAAIYPEFREISARRLSFNKMTDFIHNTIYKIVSTTVLIDDVLSLRALDQYFKEQYFSKVANGVYTLKEESKITNEFVEFNDSSVELIAQVYRDL